jgi:imidazole glycerol phosphate synthase glutamine amidotransferase subunit
MQEKTDVSRTNAQTKASEQSLIAPAIDVELVDVGGGNVGSVMRCLERLGIKYKQVQTPDQLTGTAPLILPGVGSFGAVMQFLRAKDLANPVTTLVRQGTPFLGICVGLQILFSDSEESPGVPGLDLLPGKIVKFRRGKVPQIGWNLITPTEQAKYVFPDQEYVYFVNSYFPRPAQGDVVSFTANYHETFCAAVLHKNITAFQFHPEKSGKAGERLIMRWLNEVKTKC